MPKKAKTKGGKKGRAAELLIKGWLEDKGYTVHLAAATGMQRIGPRWVVKSHDLYGCVDALGFRQDNEPETWAIQVTTDAGRSKRRRKIEQHAWPGSWRVSIVSHETQPDPNHKRRKLDFLKIQDYDDSDGDGFEWGDYIMVPINAKELEKRRKERDRLRKIAKGGNTPIAPSTDRPEPPAPTLD